MRVTKVFNNNVVLVCDPNGRRLVLMGRGIGFQARPGDKVSQDKVQQTFVPNGNDTPTRIAAYLEAIGGRELDLAIEIVEMISEEFGQHLSDSIILPLADHISVALERAERKITVDYPLRWEVEALYQREVGMGRRAIALVKERTGADLPALEAVPLALHFANAQSASGNMEETQQITDALSGVLKIVQNDLGLTLHPQNLDVARFITHLRFLALRQGTIDNEPEAFSEMLHSFENTHAREVASARRVALHLRETLGWRIVKNEVTYLALHIVRLAGTANDGSAETALARQIYEIVGGSENLTSISACATRLRLGICDVTPTVIDRLQSLPKVTYVVTRANEVHLVIAANLTATLRALRTIPV